MPETGNITADQISEVSGEGAPEAPWTIEGATVHTATFEIDTAAALAHMPFMLSRPAPTYGRIFAIEYPESPIGPYREALLLVSCRYLMLPRQFIAGSIVSNEKAMAANAQNWHYRSELGEVTIEPDGNSAASTIAGPGVYLQIQSFDGVSTGPDGIRYDPFIIAQPGKDEVDVLTVSAAPADTVDAFIANDTDIEYRSGARDSAWSDLRSTNPITGTFARHTITLPKPEVIEIPEMMRAALNR